MRKRAHSMFESIFRCWLFKPYNSFQELKWLGGSWNYDPPFCFQMFFTMNSVKKKIILLSCLCLFALTIVFFVFIGSKRYIDNNFVRVFPPHAILNGRRLDVGYNSYYFAGETSNSVFLGSFVAPSFILRVGLRQLDTQMTRLQIPIEANSIHTSQRMLVDSPVFTLADGSRPGLTRFLEPSLMGMQTDLGPIHFLALSRRSHLGPI